MIHAAFKAIRRITSFLAGHSPAQLLNLSSGVVILWLLPASEYAAYTVAAALISFGNVSSDPGASQAILTLGSRVRGDKAAITSLVEACKALRRRILSVSSVALAVLGSILLYRTGTSTVQIVAVILLTLASLISQRRLSIHNAVFYVYGNTNAIFRSLTWPSAIRLTLVVICVSAISTAWMALLVNVIATLVQDYLSKRLVSHYLDFASVQRVDDSLRLVKQFVYPLLPGIAYFLIHSQITTVLLAWMGRRDDVAALGALSRIWQVFSILAFLNGLVQPYFARLTSPSVFRKRSLVLVVLWTIFSLLIVTTTYFFPAPWMLILGPRYAHLDYLLPLCVAAALATVAGGAIYSVVISTGNTRLQALQIPFGLSAQFAVAYVTGLQTIGDALLLASTPSFCNMIFQLALLATSNHLSNQSNVR